MDEEGCWWAGGVYYQSHNDELPVCAFRCGWTRREQWCTSRERETHRWKHICKGNLSTKLYPLNFVHWTLPPNLLSTDNLSLELCPLNFANWSLPTELFSAKLYPLNFVHWTLSTELCLLNFVHRTLPTELYPLSFASVKGRLIEAELYLLQAASFFCRHADALYPPH